MEEQKKVEYVLGTLVIVLLLIVVLLAVGSFSASSKSTGTTSNVVISNSFNTNIINENNNEGNYYDKNYGDSSHNRDNDYCREYTEKLPFSSRKEHRAVTTLLGNKIDRYYVYVKNLAYTGGYFTVKFYFRDYYGREDAYSLTKYINAREEASFVFQNVYESRYQVTNWDYEVISESEESLGCD